MLTINCGQPRDFSCETR